MPLVLFHSNETYPFLFSVVEINWNYIGDSVPAFLTILIIPLTFKLVTESFCSHISSIYVSESPLYSIAYGVIAGILSYILLNGIPLILKKVSGGKIIPADYDASEEWVIPAGGMTPPWM